jgi:hypothetical protein
MEISQGEKTIEKENDLSVFLLDKSFSLCINQKISIPTYPLPFRIDNPLFFEIPS